MRHEVNEVTGNTQAIFNAKLLSIDDEVSTMNNEKETLYRKATIQYVDEKTGNIHNIWPTIVYEKSFERGMVVGQEYVATAEDLGEGNIFTKLSHLIPSERASSEMFGFENSKKKATATVIEAEKAVAGK